MTAEYEIHNVYFEQGSIVIGYIELPNDVRVSGQVIRQHQLRLATAHPDYAEDASSLHAKAVRVLKNALEDFDSSVPYTPEVEADEDDDKGMGE